MSLEIKIDIPPGLSSNSDLIPYFQEQLGRLADALDRDVSDFDKKAQIDEIHVRKIEVTSEGIAVTYELRFSAFYACSDLDYRGRHERVLPGRRNGDFWIFQPHCPLPARSTLDEL